MAKKYIDADLLRKAVEKQIDYAKGVYPKGSMEAERATVIIAVCLDILASIDSLQQEQPELPNKEIAEYYYHKGVYEGLSQGRADALKILDEFMKRKADPVIVIKQQEQPCDTCTNDKGCVTCKDGELWEGKEQPQ